MKYEWKFDWIERSCNDQWLPSKICCWVLKKKKILCGLKAIHPIELYSLGTKDSYNLNKMCFICVFKHFYVYYDETLFLSIAYFKKS